MRILFLSERFPWPLEDGGNLRTFHLLRALAQKHEVTLIAHQRTGIHGHPLDNFCRTKVVGKSSRLNTLLHRSLTRSAWMKSIFINKNWSDSLLRAAKFELENGSYDLVHCNHLDTACYLETLGWPKSVFDSHNCLSLMANERAKSASVLKPILQLEAGRLKALERKVCQRSQLVLACSKDDAREFIGMSGARSIVVVPNGVEYDYYCPQGPPKRDSDKLVFIGAMDYLPNIEAVEWFCREVLPLIKLKRPETTFEIVGRSPSVRVKRLAKPGTVTVIGRVDDVRPFLYGCGAVVVPLQHGGGTRLKILEAMASGCPVISTSKGAQGIDCTDGKDIVIADSVEDFRHSTLRVLADETVMYEMSSHALATSRQYSWDLIGANMLQRLEI